MADYRNRPPVDAPRELRFNLDSLFVVVATLVFAASGLLVAVALGYAW